MRSRGGRGMLGPLRRRLAQRLSFAAAGLAPRMPEGAICMAERLIRFGGPHLPVLGAMVEENLRSAGLYDRHTVSAYFEQVARHFGSALHIFRLAGGPAV